MSDVIVHYSGALGYHPLLVNEKLKYAGVGPPNG